MTTYQEPPLQSRRAARAVERADAAPADSNAEAATLPPAFSSAESSAEPLNYTTTSRPPLPQYDGQGLRPRRSAETPEHADLPPAEGLPNQDAPLYRPRDFSPEGRRAVAPTWPQQSEGTVDYQTQNREQVLHAATTGTAATVAAAPVTAIPEGTMTRRELRALREASGIEATATDQQTVVDAQPSAVSEARPVDTPPVAAPPVSAPQAWEPPVQEPAVQEPAVQEPAAAQEPAVQEPVAPEPWLVAPPFEPVALVTPPPLIAPAPQSSSRLDSALAEFDALAAGREPQAPAADVPAPLPGRRAAQQAPFEAPVDAPVEPTTVPPAPAPTEGLSAFDALFAVPSQEIPTPPTLHAPAVVTPEVAPAALVNPLLSAPAPQGAPASVPPPASAYPAPIDLPAPSATVLHAPVGPASGPTSVGHWSTQSDLDDAEQVNESTISRNVGGGHGAITTSALVLPSVPEQAIGGPVGTAGEILLTGSISLPQSLSATGAHPSQLDESDLDHLLDPGDHQVANTDSTPVRAIRAVSTHTATGGIIAPHKPSGTRGFTILIIAAAAMAAVVVGLLVVGFVSGTI